MLEIRIREGCGLLGVVYAMQGQNTMRMMPSFLFPFVFISSIFVSIEDD